MTPYTIAAELEGSEGKWAFCGTAPPPSDYGIYREPVDRLWDIRLRSMGNPGYRNIMAAGRVLRITPLNWLRALSDTSFSPNGLIEPGERRGPLGMLEPAEGFGI